ncbi:type II toxin-antitoxin system RelE/ParE family toxin [Kaustia mangrovi]|uniref:Type II toxin-antitoxin system RelE/ParE family toxin n=1 Tax=Kaustia mangrovi TaxID=2593653 RepID=A0A7S8HD03_9HYPH|nr:type II toxin-antitoxin system RelE/ParE family toxin [Kaustia mangrovi]QPC43994.1 type II toxin-antitoxin system RelE/ParE family toxin [Kaustia mangrovi]
MMKITYSKDAVRYLNRMPANRKRQIIAKMDQYAADPAALANNVKPLKGGLGYRLRVGNYRVIFTVSEDTVRVLEVGPRGSIYED